MVEISTTDATDPDAPAFAPADRIAITLTNGRVLDADEIHFARGHANLPLTTGDMWNKFSDCVSRSAGEEMTRELFDRLQAVDEINSTADLPTLG